LDFKVICGTIGKMEVHVIKDDLEKAVPGASARCAFALALQRTLNDPEIRVGIGHWWINGKFESTQRKLSAKATKFILAVDSRKKVEPQSFNEEN